MKKIVLTLLFITTIFAQDVVSIVTSGDGPTKDQATTAALRNAIEQAYGAFISSNTKFLNDELIQDEIVSLSQGTITEYSIISSIETKNGYNVTTKSTVSLGKLTSFVQSKGGSITINGSSFYRNLLIEEFYDTNEHKAIEDFIDSRLKSVQVFDFNLFSKEPFRDDYGRIAFNSKIGIKPNENMHKFFDDLKKLLKNISLNEETVNFRVNSNLNVFDITIFDKKGRFFEKSKTYNLRSRKSFQIIQNLEDKLLQEAANYELKAKLTNGSSVYLDTGTNFSGKNYFQRPTLVVSNWNMLYRGRFNCKWLENLGGNPVEPMSGDHLKPFDETKTIWINPFKLNPKYDTSCSYSSMGGSNKYEGKYVLIVEKKITLNDNIIRNLNEIFIEAF